MAAKIAAAVGFWNFMLVTLYVLPRLSESMGMLKTASGILGQVLV